MSEFDLQVLLLAGRFEVRGSCAYTLRLAEGLEKERVAARIVTPDARLVDSRVRRRVQIEEVRRLGTPVWGKLAGRFLLNEVRENPPHVIHIQSIRALRYGSRLARRLGRPYVLTVHKHVDDGTRFRIDRHDCRKVIAVSDSVRDDLVRRFEWPGEMVTVIPSGVDTTVAADVRLPLEPGRVPVIGTASPLEAVKGLPWFLGAARHVLEARSDVEFLVAGAGPEESNLRRVARELEIAEKVTFVPYLLSFTESLSATDIFVLPSLQQGLGTIMLEAMALGRPVIATGVGGVSSVIHHGETGLIVPPQNSGELARRILELLEQPALARALGTRARELVVERYNVESMVHKTAQVYRAVAAAVPLPEPAERRID
jgi:glycosyltransferase involved in cell wall biosynthesis